MAFTFGATKPVFTVGNIVNTPQQSAFTFVNNNNQQQSSLSFGNKNNNQIEKLPLSLNIVSSPIIKAMQVLDDIHKPIKNKYVGIDDLTNFIEKTEILLQLAIDSKNFLLTNIIPSLNVIFPAIEHLNLFLSDADIGALALVSTNLYDLLISTYGELKIDICIAKHHIENDAYDYSVDVNFCTLIPSNTDQNDLIQKIGEFAKEGPYFVQDTHIKSKIPLKVKTIALKRLRKLIGQDLYFSEHKIIFFKDDIMYLYDKYEEIIPNNSKVCMFCYTSNSGDHGPCYLKFINDIKRERANKEMVIRNDILEKEREILFNDHINNGVHDKEFKYFLHNGSDFSKEISRRSYCMFCNNKRYDLDEVCTVNYRDIINYSPSNDEQKTNKDYYIKEYMSWFNRYFSHIQPKTEYSYKSSWNLTQEEKLEKAKNEREAKSYSFCIYPEFEYIYA